MTRHFIPTSDLSSRRPLALGQRGNGRTASGAGGARWRWNLAGWTLCFFGFIGAGPTPAAARSPAAPDRDRASDVALPDSPLAEIAPAEIAHSVGKMIMAPETRVEEIVAVVNGRPVLLGELDIDARLFRARTLEGGRLDGPVRAEELAAALERVIDGLVVHAEAERLQVFEVPESELDRAFGELRRAVGSEELDAFLRDFDLHDEDLLLFLRRELRVVRYLEGRFRLASRPRDSEVQEAVRVAAKEGRVASPDTIREALARERFLELTRDFVRDLRRRSRVRVIRDPLVRNAGSRLWGTVSAAEVGESDGGARR